MKRTWTAGLTAAVIATIVLSGCGGSSSSTTKATATQASASGKPSYCADVASLEQSVKGLRQVKPIQNGTQSLEKAFTQVKSDAQALVSSVKDTFSSQATALKSSVDQLSATVGDFAKSPSTATLSTLKSQIASLGTSVKSVASATSGQCK